MLIFVLPLMWPPPVQNEHTGMSFTRIRISYKCKFPTLVLLLTTYRNFQQARKVEKYLKNQNFNILQVSYLMI